MYLDIEPLRCFLTGQTPGAVFQINVSEDHMPVVNFLADDGVLHWDLPISNFSLGTEIGNDELSTFNYVATDSFDGPLEMEEFSSPYLTQKEVWVRSFKKRARYVRTYIFQSGGWIERAHLLVTPAGNLALVVDFDCLIGIEPEAPKAEETKPTSKKVIQREPIRTAGHAGANMLDMLGITLPDVDMT